MVLVSQLPEQIITLLQETIHAHGSMVRLAALDQVVDDHPWVFACGCISKAMPSLETLAAKGSMIPRPPLGDGFSKPGRGR